MASFTQQAKNFQFPKIPNNKKAKEAFFYGFFEAAKEAGLTYKQASELANSLPQQAQEMPQGPQQAPAEGGQPDISPEEFAQLLKNPEIQQLLMQLMQQQQPGQ